MTHEFAIAILRQDIERSKNGIPYWHDKTGIEALDLAIKALEDKGYDQGYKEGYAKGFEEGVVLG